MGWENYKKHNDYKNNRATESSKKARDIGAIPPVVDPQRKANCEHDLQLFCETYFAPKYYLQWSADHLKVIAQLQEAILNGGLFSIAMARGSGKTSLCESAATWALLYGHREFLALVAANEQAAEQILTNIKIELDSNDLLLADFPEVCLPIRKLEGIFNRTAGQLCQGERTKIKWCADEVALPTIPGSKASGAIIKVAGITGRIRGMNTTRPSDGASIRPSLCIIDDPQSDESARSPAQTKARLDVLRGAVLGLAGPGKKIAAICPCTVIQQNDLADQLLDREKNPEWKGQRCKLVYSWSTNQKLWDEYAKIWQASLETQGNFAPATEFYQQHREEMDRGSIVGWEQRFNDDELSAIQHAFNLRLGRGEEAFAAEFQNTPLPPVPDGVHGMPTPDEVAKKINHLKPGVCPLESTKVVCHIDVQLNILFYAVMAFTDDFSGAVIEYGTYPKQHKLYFTLRDNLVKLSDVHKGLTPESAIVAGLDVLVDRLANTAWQREDNQELHISRLLVDAGYETDVISKWCRSTPHRNIVLPAHGKGITADKKPLDQWVRKPGDKQGIGWRISASGTQVKRHILFDTNYWKTFLMHRWNCGLVDAGNLYLYKASEKQHQLFADHATAEFPTPTFGWGRTVNIWKLRPGRDNHHGDNLVGCYVAAAEQGCKLPLSVVAQAINTTSKSTTSAITMADVMPKPRKATSTPKRRPQSKVTW